MPNTTNLLDEIEAFIKDYNQDHACDFSIDTIRIEFQKQYKLKELHALGKWHKISARDTKIMSKLKKRLNDDEITTAYQYKHENIYYFNSSTPPKYRKATLVIFGMKQYHKAPPDRELIGSMVRVLKHISNVDICIDLEVKPNLAALQTCFNLNQYITKEGVFTDTHYIHNPHLPMIEKITIYNKAKKNKLKSTLWRIEAKVIIPNPKLLTLPLHDLKFVADLARKP